MELACNIAKYCQISPEGWIFRNPIPTQVSNLELEPQRKLHSLPSRTAARKRPTRDYTKFSSPNAAPNLDPCSKRVRLLDKV